MEISLSQVEFQMEGPSSPNANILFMFDVIPVGPAKGMLGQQVQPLSLQEIEVSFVCT